MSMNMPKMAVDVTRAAALRRTPRHHVADLAVRPHQPQLEVEVAGLRDGFPDAALDPAAIVGVVGGDRFLDRGRPVPGRQIRRCGTPRRTSIDAWKAARPANSRRGPSLPRSTGTRLSSRARCSASRRTVTSRAATDDAAVAGQLEHSFEPDIMPVLVPSPMLARHAGRGWASRPRNPLPPGRGRPDAGIRTAAAPPTRPGPILRSPWRTATRRHACRPRSLV